MGYDFSTAANSLEEFWMPFTPQRAFKKAPRMVVSADGMYYKSQDGKDILDAAAGLWCVNAGHNSPRVVEAVKSQLDLLDFACNFKYGHPTAFKAASRMTSVMPETFNHVFFSNSGSEAVDTALKIALAYQRIKGEGTRRTLIGRERAYHGVGFGGISVGGIPYNRTTFGQLLPNVAHLPHTLDLEKNAFSKGQPEHGAHLAEELEKLVYMHDASNIAAVIVEPVAGSTGVLPPPKGYLQKLREICDKYGILLIFDEVITGYGRLGDYSSSSYFGVRPDIICTAKGISNGTVPMGATFVSDDIYNEFMNGPEQAIELMHGYTYSGHPLAAAAAIATLDTFQDDKIMENAKAMFTPWENALHDLKDLPRVVDIRNCGIIGAIEFEAHNDEGDAERYAREVFEELFERGIMARYTGCTIALSPPLILDQSHIDQLFTTIREVVTDLL